MNIIGKKIIFSFLIVFLIVFQPITINAEENLSFKNEAINPGSFYYPFKRVWEKGMDKLQFSNQSKINYYKSQLSVRLAELNYVVENKVLSEVQTSSERFAYQAGILTDEVVKSNKNKDKIMQEFKQMQVFLGPLRDKYPANSSFWMLVQHDINTLGILSEKLK